MKHWGIDIGDGQSMTAITSYVTQDGVTYLQRTVITRTPVHPGRALSLRGGVEALRGFGLEPGMKFKPVPDSSALARVDYMTPERVRPSPREHRPASLRPHARGQNPGGRARG